MTKFYVYDVFNDYAFGGNPLAVIPDATKIPEAKLQKIAREFNFSETTFVYPPADPSHTAKVRIFTPTSEIAFAGHPTIGTAIALSDQGTTGDLVLELGVGPIPCKVAGNAASFSTSVPLEIIAKPEPALVAAALSLPQSALVTRTHHPVQATLGLPFVICELDTLASLSACVPNIDKIREGATRYPAGLDFALFAYVRDGGEVAARMFAPLDNMPEDPATGSAVAALAALLTDILGETQSLQVRQGDDMGRPSRISATTTHTPGCVTIAGQAVKTMEGTLFV